MTAPEDAPLFPFAIDLDAEGGRLIARGGMGEVREVFDPVLERVVAVKRLRPELAERPDEVASFLREARITGQLDHPNIVPVHGLLTQHGPAYAMKRVQGVTLRRELERLGANGATGRALERLVRVVLQVCDAVAYAHMLGVLHLDLKPDNVMLGSHGQVYVMDWGIAVRCAPDAHGFLRPIEGYDDIRGTAAYMAPEQRTEGLRAVDQRSDVYGIGAILHEMLVGVPPLESAERSTVDADGPRALPSARLAAPLRKAPPGLLAVALRAVAADPRDRPQSVEALRGELEQLLRGGAWFERKRFAAGHTIVREGDRTDVAYVVVEGRCDVFKAEGDAQNHVGTLEPGEVFGESALVPGARRGASVVAASDVTLLVVTREAVEQELGERGWLGALVSALTQRVAEAQE